MNRLSSNASARVIIETKKVRSNLTYVVDARRRRDMINEWKTADDESAIRNMEMLFPYQKRQMSEEVWNRIRGKVEN